MEKNKHNTGLSKEEATKFCRAVRLLEEINQYSWVYASAVVTASILFSAFHRNQ